MPWSFVGAVKDPDETSTTKAVTTGNLLIVGFEDQTSGDTLTISDGVNTWTRIGTQLNDTVPQQDYSMTWWWAVAATTATITATISGQGGGHHGLWIAEYSHSSGAIPADSLVASNGNGAANGLGSGSTATDGDTSGAATPGFDGCLIVGWIFDSQEGSGTGTSHFAAGTSFTERATASNDSVEFQQIWSVEDREQTTSASAAATWTCVNTDSYAALVGFFKPPTGAGTPPAPSLSDAATVTEVQTLNVKDMPSVFNSVTADELIKLMMPVYASLSDSVTLSEQVALTGLAPGGTRSINVNDAVSVTESVGNTFLTDGVFRQAAIAHASQVTFSFPIRPQNALIAFIRWTLSTTVPNLLSISDTNGNPWTLINTPKQLGGGLRVQAALVINAATTATTPTVFANFDTPPSDVWIAMHEVTTRDVQDPFEGEDWNTQGGPTGVDSITTGPVTTIRVNSYIFGAATESGSGVVTHAGTNFLMRTRDVPVSVGIITEDRIRAAAGVADATFSPDPLGQGYASLVVALRYARFWPPSVAESITVTDAVGLGLTIGLALLPQVNDAVAVAESVTLLEKPAQLSVSDTVTVSELAQNNIASLGISISVFDTVLMEGAPAPVISVSDAIAVTELVLLAARGVQVADTVVVTEATTVRLRIFINVHDDAFMSLVPEGGENLTVTENITLNFVTFGSRAINVSDSITVTELTIRQFNPMRATVSDAVSVTDFAAVIQGAVTISVNDAVAVTEVVTALTAANPAATVNDAVSVTENVLVVLKTAAQLVIVVNELVTITESTVLIGAPNITVSDAVTVTEFVSVAAPARLTVSLADAITVTDAASLSVAALGGINVGDAITVTDVVTGRLSLIRLSVFEDVSVGEGRDMALSFLQLSVGDLVLVGEDVAPQVGVRVAVPRIRGMFAWEHWIRRQE
jgi:hypothetical protein